MSLDANSPTHSEPVVSILHFEVPDAVTQATFLQAYRRVIEHHVSGWPGFLAATLHASTDGTRIVATVRWRGEASYQHFLTESDAEARMAAIAALFEAVPAIQGPQMDRVHTYRVATGVLPTP